MQFFMIQLLKFTMLCMLEVWIYSSTNLYILNLLCPFPSLPFPPPVVALELQVELWIYLGSIFLYIFSISSTLICIEILWFTINTINGIPCEYIIRTLHAAPVCLLPSNEVPTQPSTFPHLSKFSSVDQLFNSVAFGHLMFHTICI